MRKKLMVETFDAYQVNVEMEGDINEYALNFLKIFNTVKTEEDLIRVTNNYGNDVQVVCTEDVVEETKKYLSNFGKVTRVEKVLCANLVEDVPYDFDKYDDFVIVPYED